MNHKATLTITSLLSILLVSLHVTDDIVRGISRPAADNLGAIAIFVVWLLGPLVLAERRSGYVIMLLGGLIAALMPVLHMRGARYPTLAASDGGYFFVWTLIACGAIGTFSAILSARALWVSVRGDRSSLG